MDNKQQRNDQPNNGGNQGPQGGPNKNRSTLTFFLAVTLISLVAMGLINNLINNVGRDYSYQEITYDEFLDKLDDGQVQSVVIGSSQINIEPKITPDNLEDVGKMYYTGVTNDPYLVERLDEAGVTFSTEIPDTTSNLILNIILSFAPLIIIWVIFAFVMRRMSKNGGGIMGVGKSRAKVYVQKETGVTFKDVAGQDEAKESLQEVVDFLENPGKYTTIGAKLPKGALLVGPPGQAKLFSPRQWPAKLSVLFSPCPVQTLWRCSWAWELPVFGICLKRPRRMHPASSLLMRLTPSEKAVIPDTEAAMTRGSRL